jgi:hypothetical protein
MSSSTADECSVQALLEAYDLPLHVASVFIIAAFSLLGALLPVIAHWAPRSHLPEKFLVAGNYFGTGVVIATAFVHMIPVSHDDTHAARDCYNVPTAHACSASSTSQLHSYLSGLRL